MKNRKKMKAEGREGRGGASERMTWTGVAVCSGAVLPQAPHLPTFSFLVSPRSSKPCPLFSMFLSPFSSFVLNFFFLCARFSPINHAPWPTLAPTSPTTPLLRHHPTRFVCQNWIPLSPLSYTPWITREHNPQEANKSADRLYTEAPLPYISP